MRHAQDSDTDFQNVQRYIHASRMGSYGSSMLDDCFVIGYDGCLHDIIAKQPKGSYYYNLADTILKDLRIYRILFGGKYLRWTEREFDLILFAISEPQAFHMKNASYYFPELNTEKMSLLERKKIKFGVLEENAFRVVKEALFRNVPEWFVAETSEIWDLILSVLETLGVESHIPNRMFVDVGEKQLIGGSYRDHIRVLIFKLENVFTKYSESFQKAYKWITDVEIYIGNELVSYD